MAKIQVKQLEALTADDGGLTLQEDGGIVGRARVGQRGITVLLRYEFKLNGAKRDQALGSWPKKSLAFIKLFVSKQVFIYLQTRCSTTSTKSLLCC